MGTYYGRHVTSSEEEQMHENDDDKSDNKEDTSKERVINNKKPNNSNEEANIRVTLPYKPKGEMFAVAETFQGGSRLQLICEDGERRMGRIPGKLRRRMWVRENDLLIVVPWSFQDSKADVKFRYTPTQTANLKKLGKIPEILDIY
tara:strand:- start:990 stop:1427 length:438 start_codon:yes stop_codon:yes gene_type:complete